MFSITSLEQSKKRHEKKSHFSPFELTDFLLILSAFTPTSLYCVCVSACVCVCVCVCVCGCVCVLHSHLCLNPCWSVHYVLAVYFITVSRPMYILCAMFVRHSEPQGSHSIIISTQHSHWKAPPSKIAVWQGDFFQTAVICSYWRKWSTLLLKNKDWSRNMLIIMFNVWKLL